MDNIEKRKGELYLFLSVLIWAFFPIVTTLTFASLPSLLSLGWSTVFATLFFGSIVAYRKKWAEMRNPILWKYVLYGTFFIGLLFYSFYFLGLARTTAGNAAIIAQFEILTAFIFFNLLRKEDFSFEHKTGAVLMIAGALIVLWPSFSGIDVGGLLVLIATMCAPPGNYFQQKAREIASSETIMFLRSALATVVVFLLAYILNERASSIDVWDSLIFLIVNGVLIFGLSKIFWLEAIHRISVTKANALQGITPLATLILAWIFLSQIPSVLQLVSLIPLLFGILLLTDQLNFKRILGSD